MAAGVKEDTGIPKTGIYNSAVTQNLYIYIPGVYLIIGTFNPKERPTTCIYNTKVWSTT
jgi:hypothetical protein